MNFKNGFLFFVVGFYFLPAYSKTEKPKAPPPEAEAHLWEASLGFGNSLLMFKVNEDITYTSTNSSYLNLGTGTNVFSVGFKIPFKDPKESRENSVDSDVTDYQFSFKLSSHIQTEFYYQKYKGYFVTQLDTPGVALNDLTLTHYGFQAFYVLDETHKSFQFANSTDKQVENSGSWIVSFGFNRFSVEGDLIPPAFRDSVDQTITSADIKTGIIRGGYSYNWIWTGWFAGLAAGYGLNYNIIKTDLKGSTEKSDLSYHFAGAYGYSWDKSKLGAYGRIYSWEFEIADISISSQAGNMGVYYSYLF